MQTLADLTKKIGDGIHSTPNYVEKSDLYFINGNNLANGRIVFFENTKNISIEEYEKYDLNFPANTVLLSINGTIGNIAFYQNEKIILGKSVSYITCNEKLNKNFLFYILQSEYIKKIIQKEMTSTTIFNLSLTTIRNLPMNLPEIYEQQKIASILSGVDALIESTQKVIEKTERLKKGVMQYLLTTGIGSTKIQEGKMVS